MRIFLLLILSWFFILSGTAQIVTIPDANFKNALLTHVPVINTNNDGEIQVSEALAFTGKLNVSNKNIADITGVGAFFNISGLLCDNNHFPSLTITNFLSLSELDCHYSNITTLTISNLPALRTLNCSYNYLSGSFSFNNYPALVTLNCSANFNITSISLSSIPSLQILNINSCRISTLNHSVLPALKNFDCSGNLLTSLSVDNINFPELEYLWCSQNRFTNLVFDNLPNLKKIYCDYCPMLASLQVTNLPQLTWLWSVNSYNLSNLQLSNLPALEELDIFGNKLTDLPLSNLPSLQKVYCFYNQITSLSLNKLPSLLLLHCWSNKIASIQFTNLPALKYLKCDSNKLSVLDLSQAPVTDLECRANPSLKYINIKNDSISSTSYRFSLPDSLESICVDDAELNFVTTMVNQQLPGHNVSVSSFCNFNPTGKYNTITGTVKFDEANNGCNSLDSTMNNVRINITDGTQSGSTFTNAAGQYKFYVQLTPDTVTTTLSNALFTANPLSHILNFIGYGNTQVADFCVTANGIHPDLEIILLPVTVARPGFDAQYKLVYRNKGNQLQSGTVTLNFDALKLNFLSAIPNVTSQTAGNLSWNYSGLTPYETRTITLLFHVNAPPVVNIGDVLIFTALINPITGDETPNDNAFTFNQVVTGAYDPNDKQVTEGSSIHISKIGDYLHYIVRFQNTGNEAAISVVIKDSLAANLDWNSFIPVDASHPYRTVIAKGNKVDFIFDGINLPGKNTNEPASHGFVAFKIKPRSMVTVGETIYNKAEIYFDFNLPVITNTVSTTIIDPKQTDDAVGLNTYPNPVKDNIWFTVKPGVRIQAINLYNSIGEKIYSEAVVNTATSKNINIANIPPGILFLEVITDQGKATQKVIRVK